VKVLDNELPFEEPHVTIVFKTKLWRLSLRSRTFLDEDPDPGQVPKGLMDVIWTNFNTLSAQWDAKFSTNPISNIEHDDEEK